MVVMIPYEFKITTVLVFMSPLLGDEHIIFVCFLCLQYVKVLGSNGKYFSLNLVR